MATFLPVTPASQLKTGDILKVDSFVPLVDHYAIVFESGGKQYIAENKFITGGLASEPLDEYRLRRNITGYLRNDKTQLVTNEQITSKMQECYEDGYKFWQFNCEDFVRFASGEEIGYDQRKKWGWAVSGVILGGIVGYFAFRKKKIGGFWGAVIGAGAVALILILIRQVNRLFSKNPVPVNT